MIPTSFEIARANTGSINGGSSKKNFLTIYVEPFTKMTFQATTYANGGGYLSGVLGGNTFNDSEGSDWYGNPCQGFVNVPKNTDGSYDVSDFKYVYFNAANSGSSYSGVELRHIVLS